MSDGPDDSPVPQTEALVPEPTTWELVSPEVIITSPTTGGSTGFPAVVSGTVFPGTRRVTATIFNATNVAVETQTESMGGGSPNIRNWQLTFSKPGIRGTGRTINARTIESPPAADVETNITIN